MEIIEKGTLTDTVRKWYNGKYTASRAYRPARVEIFQNHVLLDGAAVSRSYFTQPLNVNVRLIDELWPMILDQCRPLGLFPWIETKLVATINFSYRDKILDTLSLVVSAGCLMVDQHKVTTVEEATTVLRDWFARLPTSSAYKSVVA